MIKRLKATADIAIKFRGIKVLTTDAVGAIRALCLSVVDTSPDVFNNK